MTRKKSRLGSSGCGARARKDRLAANNRAAKAAALREEFEDIQEDVVPPEHKGGEVGEFVRLKRWRRSRGSGDAAQLAPQPPLPVASLPPP